MIFVVLATLMHLTEKGGIVRIQLSSFHSNPLLPHRQRVWPPLNTSEAMNGILIVDQESDMRNMLASNLHWEQCDVSEAASVEEAKRSLAASNYNVVFTDQKMPDGEGFEVLAAALEIDPTISVVVLSARASIELAVESMRRGAFDFLAKPFSEDVVRGTARRACQHTILLRESRSKRNQTSSKDLPVSPRIGVGTLPVFLIDSQQRAHFTATDAPPKSFNLSAFLDQTEKELIVRTLASTRGAQAEAARRMGLSRSALAYKLTKYGLRDTV